MDGEVELLGEDGGGGCDLSEGHVDGFESGGAEGDVGGAVADGDEEIGGLVRFWGDGFVGNSESLEDAGVGGAFGLDFAFASDAEGGVVVGDVSVVVDQDDVFSAAFVKDVFFGEDVSADHAASFANVEEFRPVAVSLELICGESPL